MYLRRSKIVLLMCLLGLGVWITAIEARAQIKVKSATLTMQADDEFWVFLNGHLIHETESIPSSQWNRPQTDLKVDPKWFKSCGQNVLGIYFYDIPGGKTFLIYKLQIKLSDGSKMTLYSDGDEKILSVGTVYDAKKKGDKTWATLGKEGVAYPSREPRLPALWHTAGEEFNDSAWEGTGQCYFDNNALKQDAFFEIGRFQGDFVPAIRPNVVGKDCDVEKEGGTYLVRETFEINPCAGAKPKPVCPGWFINAGSGFHFVDQSDNKWVADQVYGKDGNKYGRVIPKGKDPQMGRKIGDIQNTQEDNVYHTFAQPNKKSINYRFDLEPGAYTVTLRFMEPRSRTRTLNVNAEGMPALENFSPAASAGGALLTAVDKSFSIQVDDGSLDIELLSVKGKAIISGIGIICGATQAMLAPKEAPTPSPQAPPPPPLPTPTSVPLRAFAPPSLPPTPTPRPFLPTPTMVMRPTRTPIPTPVPVRLEKVEVPWKILSVYYNFKGLLFGNTEFRFKTFRKITIQKMPVQEGRDHGAITYKAHVVLLDKTEYDLKRFTRYNPKTRQEFKNVVLLRGTHLVMWDFSKIQEIEAIGGLEAFKSRTGEAILKITLKDGTVQHEQ